MNSFKFLLAAMKYEVTRQARILDSGGEVVQETMLFDENTGKTVAMRGKEEADDYRYFPEPDLVHVQIDDKWIDEIQPTPPELPAARRERFKEEYHILDHDIKFLTKTRDLADFFDEAAKLSGEPTACANWIMGDLTRLLNAAGIKKIQDSKVKPKHLSQLIILLLKREIVWKGKNVWITSTNAKPTFEIAFETGKMPVEIAYENGWLQDEDDAQIEEQAVLEVMEEYKEGAVKDYRNGKQEAIGFLIGQVRKATRGKADLQRVNQLLREKLSA